MDPVLGVSFPTTPPKPPYRASAEAAKRARPRRKTWMAFMASPFGSRYR